MSAPVVIEGWTLRSTGGSGGEQEASNGLPTNGEPRVEVFVSDSGIAVRIETLDSVRWASIPRAVFDALLAAHAAATVQS